MDLTDPRVRHWCNTCRTSMSSLADHLVRRHPEWDRADIEAHIRVLDLTGNLPPARIGVGSINATAATAVQAGHISASTAGRIGGLGYQVRRVWGRRAR